MHEESDTIQRKDGRWINIYGKGKHRTGQLPASKDYATVDEAVAAARLRSEQHTEPDQHTHGPLQPRGTMDPVQKKLAVADADYPQMMQPVLGPGREQLDMARPFSPAKEDDQAKLLGVLDKTIQSAKIKQLSNPTFDPMQFLNQEQMSGPWKDAADRQGTVKAEVPAASPRAGQGKFMDVNGKEQEIYQPGKSGTFTDVNGKQQKIFQDAPIDPASGTNAIANLRKFAP